MQMREDRTNEKGLGGGEWVVEGSSSGQEGQELGRGGSGKGGQPMVEEIINGSVGLRNEPGETA